MIVRKSYLVGWVHIGKGLFQLLFAPVRRAPRFLTLVPFFSMLFFTEAIGAVWRILHNRTKVNHYLSILPQVKGSNHTEDFSLK